jgi:hypothetical protein
MIAAAWPMPLAAPVMIDFSERDGGVTLNSLLCGALRFSPTTAGDEKERPDN